MVTATLVGGGYETYSYDAEGKRIRKTNGTTLRKNTSTTRTATRSARMQSSGTFNRAEIYAGDRHLATYEYVAQQLTVFIHPDWLGTERVRAASMTARSIKHA